MNRVMGTGFTCCMKTWLWIGASVFLLVGLAAGVRYAFPPGTTLSPEEETVVVPDLPSIDMSRKNPDWQVEEVTAGLDTLWSVVFTSPERMLVTERAGRLRVIENGTLKSEPLHVFDEVEERGEEGLMSLTLSQDYPRDHFLYVSLAYPSEGKLFVKVMQFRDDGSGLSDPKTIIDRIPAAQFHAGCRIAFGPDGKLYVTTGDATDRSSPQDKDSLAGKILRLDSDGGIPADNPFPGSPVWSYGHRNPQGIAWRDDTGEMYATEHGPSGFDGPGGGDEIDRIVKGGNYGWPLVSHENRLEGAISPILTFTPAVAPAALLSYSGREFPEWRGNLFFGALRGEGIVRIVVDDNDPDKIVRHEELDIGSFGRIREVVEGLDGFIYFSTSNRDGRGTPVSRDDRILRLRPTSGRGDVSQGASNADRKQDGTVLPETSVEHPDEAPADAPKEVSFRVFGAATVAPDIFLDGRGENIDSPEFFETADYREALLLVSGKGNDLVEVWKYPFKGNEKDPLLRSSLPNGLSIDQERDWLIVGDSEKKEAAIYSLPGLRHIKDIGRGKLGDGETNGDVFTRSDGSATIYVTENHRVHGFDAESGREIVSFAPKVESIEEVLVDDRYGIVYVSDEKGGESKMHPGGAVTAYAPDGKSFTKNGTNVLGQGVFSGDGEGATLYVCLDDKRQDTGRGFLIFVDQGGGLENGLEFFDRETWRHLGTLSLAGVSQTDGIASTQLSFPEYPQGVLAVHNDNKNIALVGWDKVFAATKLACE